MSILVRIVATFMLLQTMVVHAAGYEIDLDKGKVNLVPFFEYNVSNKTPLDAPPIEGWSQFHQDYVKLGFDQQTHWFRTSISNKTQYPVSFYINIGSPLLDNVSVYTLVDGKVRSAQHLGDNQPFSLRPVQHQEFVIPVSFLPNQTIETYIAVNTTGAVNFPVFLWQKEAFQQTEHYRTLMMGMFFGIVLAAIFAYVMTAVFGKSVIAGLDAVLLISLLMIVVTLSGISFQYLWPNTPIIQQHALLVLASLAIATSALLAKEKIDAVRRNLPVSRSFLITAIASLLLIPLSLLLDYQTGIYLVTSAAILICGCHLYSGFWLTQQGLKEPQDLNISVAALLLALVFIAINNFSSSALPFSNLNVLQIAMIIMVSVFSITSMKDKRVLGFKQSEEEELRDQLSAQNLELQVTLRELEEQNTELEKLNTLDSLSGIHNRRHFDKRLLAELRRSRREITNLSLIIFDIDHFKKVNDTYGHVAGDDVIRAVALTATEQLNRSSDDVFRYGGEEYAVLLPNTDLVGAAQLAEKIRSAIEALSIQTNAGSVSCTISLGVSCSNNGKVTSPKSLVELADNALYKAKQSGRNKVIVHQSEES